MPIGNGGIIGPANVPTITTASGVWSLREQQQAQGRGAWPLALTPDPYFEYTTLLLPGNGTNGANNNTFLDGSTNNFTITRNGNTTQGTFSPFSQTGWGNYFDGSGDQLTVANNSAFDFGSGNFTVEAWCYFTGSTGSVINYSNGQTSNSNFAWEIYQTSATSITTSIVQSSTNYSASSTALVANAWNHVACVRNGNTLTIYVNGVAGGTTANVTGVTANNPGSATVKISGYNNATGCITGYVSNARIVKGTAVYTGNFTPPTSPLTAISGTSLLTCQSNRFIDNSTNNFTITRNGDTSVVAFSPFNPTLPWSSATNGGSGYFDGSGDYLTTPDNVAFTVGSGNWTLEAWVYPTASPNQPIIFGQWSGGTDGSVVMMLSNDGNRYLRGLVYSGGYVDRTSGSSLQLNAWNHCAFVREGTFLNLYLNGSRVDNYSFGSGSVQDSSLVVSAGASSSGTQPFQGYICDCRFLKGTAQYTGATYTVPTAPLTAITNTSLLLNYTNAGIYDATSKNDLETVGNAQISTTQSKWGGSSISFDGTGDWLTFPASNLFIFGTGDFTIELWFYANSLSSTSILIECRNNTVGPVIYYDSGALRVNYNSSGGVLITGGSLSTGVWYHIALARSGSSTKLFVNGTQSGSTASDTNNYSNNTLIVGASYAFTQTLNGYIQDARITKGYARYTANFTAPTAAFPTL